MLFNDLPQIPQPFFLPLPIRRGEGRGEGSFARNPHDFCGELHLKDSLLSTHFQPHILALKKNLRSRRPFPLYHTPARLPQKLLFQPANVPVGESLPLHIRPPPRNRHPCRSIRAQSQHIPPCSRMPHKPQRHPPHAHAQPVFSRLQRALSVKQKLKLHPCSLKSRHTKTIPSPVQ